MTTLIGIIGSLLLVCASAVRESASRHPALMRKNQLFALGNACMFAYAILGYLAGGSVLFPILQVLTIAATVCMLTGAPERLSTPLLLSAGVLLSIVVVWISENAINLLFACGMTTLAYGFAAKPATAHRETALGLGSLMIAACSYATSEWVFLTLNVFFAMFALNEAGRLQRGR